MKHMGLEDILYKSNEFFLERAETAYNYEYFILENLEELQDLFRYGGEATPLEFICGSQAELKKLTQITTAALSKLQHLFKQFYKFIVIYRSENDYYPGGIIGITTVDWQCKAILSK